MLDKLAEQIDGTVHDDKLHRSIYATDASVYRQLPLGVAVPLHIRDLKTIVRFCASYGIPMIPRAAGTSLAGQCVGSGLVVDISQHLNRIEALDTTTGTVRVQPGVIRDHLNAFLEPHGLFFGPNTSTANRAMIGGMVGNNSCGSTSIEYGSTREHVLELDMILDDGSEVRLEPLSATAFRQKCTLPGREGAIYRQIYELLADPKRQVNIREQYPHPDIHRRNTGYALDRLLEQQPFTPDGAPVNLCALICGSEGTLGMVSSIKLQLDPLPPASHVLVCSHFTSVQAALLSVQAAMDQSPSACELMDKEILDRTADNIAQRPNRFFLQGDPAAVLMVEYRAEDLEEAERRASAYIRNCPNAYAHPHIYGPDSERVWSLRRAGLGVLANRVGDKKPVTCIEDTAVRVEDLPDYIAEFESLMQAFGQKAVYYAHAGAGELHLRPILNLKDVSDRQLFRNITKQTARLVKKYRGALSGEHGDGRVRAPFLPYMLGNDVYRYLVQVKQIWDPAGVFNPGKIVDPAPMDTDLRYPADFKTPTFDTLLDFSHYEGYLRAAEQCNGTGACRKTAESGGTMCPSYQASRLEKDCTRARANALRELISRPVDPERPFAQRELKEVLDRCLSCKACTSECPANVDMTNLKAEFLYQYQRTHGIPLRSRLFAGFSRMGRLAMLAPGLANAGLRMLRPLQSLLGIASERRLPAFSSGSLRRWFRRHGQRRQPAKGHSLYIFCDEFTNYNEVHMGRKAISLLQRLGYRIELIDHEESGRAALSKGLLPRARQLAEANVGAFVGRIDAECPLIGLEPSAILSFVDEYPKLVRPGLRSMAEQLARHCYTVEEFLYSEVQSGRITSKLFSSAHRRIVLHGHCHQKALRDHGKVAFLLSLPENYEVEQIPSGCCGMAGSFGYEKEHYALSQQIGELVLFPFLRKHAHSAHTLIAATGFSCRHQIQDGVQMKALHPAEILYDALLQTDQASA